jgi:CheY-like chemotaxis protein/anti-sigma regulatory factor (Ser/Thr protein kinase)
MLTNLLQNAARYTPDGGEIRVSCALREATDQVEIAVSDNGRGIQAELLPNIFDMFVQAHGKGEGRGLGLGLAIVKRLVELHHGSVRVESAGVGQGSTFTLRLPAGGPTTGSGDTSGVQDLRVHNGVVARLSIVLVEDNPDISEAMQELLTSLGHTVETAHDGGSGAELILKRAPQVAIVDVGLPVMDGYQVAERVRAQVGPDQVRLIAMTGFGLESDRKRAREAGFDAHLVKPADIDAVVRALSPKEC